MMQTMLRMMVLSLSVPWRTMREDDALQVFYGVLARCFVRLVRVVALDVRVGVVFTAVLQVLTVSYGGWFVHAPGAGIL